MLGYNEQSWGSQRNLRQIPWTRMCMEDRFQVQRMGYSKGLWESSRADEKQHHEHLVGEILLNDSRWSYNATARRYELNQSSDVKATTWPVTWKMLTNATILFYNSRQIQLHISILKET